MSGHYRVELRIVGPVASAEERTERTLQRATLRGDLTVRTAEIYFDEVYGREFAQAETDAVDGRCLHGCGDVAVVGGYCDECNRDACLVGPDGICGKGDNERRAS
jgi:hypothetical protein